MGNLRAPAGSQRLWTAPLYDGDTPSGSVEFTGMGGAPVTAALCGGTAILPLGSLSMDSSQIRAEYVPDNDDFDKSNGSADVQMSKAETETGAPGVSMNPVPYGQPLTLTSGVSVVGAGSGTPTGKVNFSDGGSDTLNGGEVSATSSSVLSVGSHDFTANYEGDDNFKSSQSTATTLTVVQAAVTMTVTVSPEASTYGQSVSITAKVKPANFYSGMDLPTGHVDFYADGSSQSFDGSCIDGSGSLTVSTSSLGAGPHSIHVVYVGDPNYAGTDGYGNVTVSKADSTATMTQISPQSPTYGQPVTFTATVKASGYGSGTPTGGWVTFSEGVAAIGSGQVANGSASFTTTSALSVGSHDIVATYGGDPNFNASPPSASMSCTVTPAESKTSLTSSLNPSIYGDWVTLTATVEAITSYTGMATPTGIVDLFDTSTNTDLGKPTLDNRGVATFTTSDLAVGHHLISATYNADTNYGSSYSPNLDQEVKLPTVNLVPLDTVANERSPNELLTIQDADFLVTRTAGVGKDLTVYLQFGGAWDPDAYQLTVGGSIVGDSVLIPAGFASVEVTLTALADDMTASPQSDPRTVLVAIAPSPSGKYQVGQNSVGAFSINDTTALTEVPTNPVRKPFPSFTPVHPCPPEAPVGDATYTVVIVGGGAAEGGGSERDDWAASAETAYPGAFVYNDAANAAEFAAIIAAFPPDSVSTLVLSGHGTYPGQVGIQATNNNTLVPAGYGNIDSFTIAALPVATEVAVEKALAPGALIDIRSCKSEAADNAKPAAKLLADWLGADVRFCTGADYGWSAPVDEKVDGNLIHGEQPTEHPLQAHNTVSGTVTGPDGRPAAGVTVAATWSGGLGATVTTAADGTYRILGDFGGGAVSLVPSADGRQFSPPSISVTPGTTGVSGQDFTEKANICGFVVNASGLWYSGVTVTATWLDPNSQTQTVSATTDASGSYCISGVDPGSVVTLVPNAQGRVFTPTGGTTTPISGDLSGVSFQASPNIYGTITDASGNPLAGVNISAGWQTSGGGSGTCVATTDAAGFYSLVGVGNNTPVTVFPTLPGYLFLANTVTPCGDVLGLNFTGTAVS